MFKKIIITTALCLTFATLAQAEPFSLSETLNKMPLQQGIVFSIKDSEVAHVSSVVLAEKWNVGLEAGYIDNGKLFGGVSYKLLDAKNYVSLPIIKELTFRPGIYLALDEIDTKTKLDYGISLTILSIAW